MFMQKYASAVPHHRKCQLDFPNFTFQLWLLVSVLKEIVTGRIDEYKRLLSSGAHLSGHRQLYLLTTCNLHDFSMRSTAVVFVLVAILAVTSREETTFLWMG
jgi:hypothetical protein